MYMHTSSLHHGMHSHRHLCPHGIVHFLLACLCHLLHRGATHVGRRGGSHPLIFTLGQLPRAAFLVEGGHVHHVPLQCQGLALTGFQQAGLAEGFQFLGGLVHAALGSLDIELHGFTACHLAGVLHAHLHAAAVTVDGSLFHRIFKGGIAQPVAEGVRYLFTEGIEVTVTHVDALLVEGEIDVAFRLFRLLLFLVGLEDGILNS